MNSLTNSFQLNSPFISSAFLPSQVRTNSVTNFLKSQGTPLLEKSPLFIQNSTFERQLLSTGMERSALSNKESGIFSNAGSERRNPMIIKFDIFSPTIAFVSVDFPTLGRPAIVISADFFINVPLYLGRTNSSIMLSSFSRICLFIGPSST